MPSEVPTTVPVSSVAMAIRFEVYRACRSLGLDWHRSLTAANGAARRDVALAAPLAKIVAPSECLACGCWEFGPGASYATGLVIESYSDVLGRCLACGADHVQEEPGAWRLVVARTKEASRG